MPEAELRAKLTVDSSQLQSGKDAAKQFGEEVDKSLNKGKDGAARLGESIGEVGRRLMTGDIKYALEGIAEKLIMIGGPGALALGAVAFGLHKGREELEAFDKGLDAVEKTLGKMPEAGVGIGTISKHITELQATLTRDPARPGILGMATSAIGDLGFGAESDRRAARAAEDHKEQVSQIVRLLDMEAKATDAVAAGEERIASIHAIQKERLSEIVGKHIQQADTLKLIEATNKAATAEESNERKRSRIEAFGSVFERSGLSSAELNTGKGPLADRLQLQLAGQHERIGEYARLHGSRQGAFDEFSRSEGIKAGIGNLRESEKMPEYLFKNAIDSASIFKEIKAAIDGVNGSVKGISFKNSG